MCSSDLLFDLLERNVVTNIGGMYPLGGEIRDKLLGQHEALYKAIMDRRADDARQLAGEHMDYVQEVLAQTKDEVRRIERANRRRAPACCVSARRASPRSGSRAWASTIARTSLAASPPALSSSVWSLCSSSLSSSSVSDSASSSSS